MFSTIRSKTKLSVGYSPAVKQDDDHELIARIIRAYRIAVKNFPGHGYSFWADFNRGSHELHSALLAGDSSVTISLRNPHTTELFKGFYDELSRPTHEVERESTCDYRQAYGRQIWALLVRLTEAVGAIRLRNPEPGAPPELQERDTSVESLLSALDDKLGFRLAFPNPYAHEFGLVTSRGIVGFRTIHAIYQAWRICEITRRGKASRILEIGAGLGKTAYYAWQFGLRDYTIVDIPLTNVAQADFLGRTLGTEHVQLYGETSASTDRVRIVGPEWLQASVLERFDIAFNADSLPELDQSNATQYFEIICDRSDIFLSINHEINGFRVADLPLLAGRPVTFERYPYWLRDGYVEEIAHLRNSTPELSRLAQMLKAQHDRFRREELNLRSRRVLLRRLFELTFKS
jgi:hypothetical protein